MGWKIKPVRTIEDAVGTISHTDGPDIPVRFDLKATEDALNGMSRLKLGLGNLRYGAEFKLIVSALARSGAHLTLRGNGVQAAIVLYGPNRFTVIERG
jgi:hypothetical protein